MDDTLESLFGEVAAGRITPTAAAEAVRRQGVSAVGDFAHLDLGRAHRKGVPEVVFAEGKSVEQLVAVVQAFLKHASSVVCSRASAAHADAVRAVVEGSVEHDSRSGVLVARRADYRPPVQAGVVGVLAAGTSDAAVAEEAATVCREMGATVLTAYDVGVAGIHRLGEPLQRILDGGATVLIVAAGMEGALPSVVAGLVDIPVIGLPTSTGYGLGGHGEAALLGMLQSCSPGLVVVNIDNGVGAGASAGLIAKRSA